MKRTPVVKGRLGRRRLVGFVGTTVIVAGTATVLANRVSARKAEGTLRTDEQQVVQKSKKSPRSEKTMQSEQPETPAEGDVAGTVLHLADLRAEGILTDDQFIAAAEATIVPEAAEDSEDATATEQPPTELPTESPTESIDTSQNTGSSTVTSSER